MSPTEFFMPTTQQPQRDKMTSHHHQKEPHQTDDAELNKEGGGG